MPRLKFHDALPLVLNGHRAFRAAWPEGTFIYLVPGSTFNVSRAPLMGIFPEGTTIDYKPHIDICDADNVAAVWDITQEDAMASDWDVMEKA